MKIRTEGEFRAATLNNALLYAALRSGGDAQDCVVVLDEENRNLKKRIVELASISPKKITMDGKTYVWHCPNELVPWTK